MRAKANPSPVASLISVAAADRDSSARAADDLSCGTPGDDGSAHAALSKLITLVFDAIGRRDDIAGVNSTRFAGTNTTTNSSGTAILRVERITVYPSDFYVIFHDAKGAATEIVDTPKFSYERVGQNTAAIPLSQLADLRLAVRLDPIYVAKYRGEFMCGLDGNETIGKINALKLKISSQGVEAHWYVDPANGQLLRTSYSTAAGGPAVTDYSDWRSVGPIKVAYKRHSVTSRETDDVTVEQYEVNPKVDPKLFDSPPHLAPGTRNSR